MTQMGLSHLTRLRVGLSKLNFHKFRHNFKDTVNPMCPTNDGVEDTEYFLLLCPSFVVQRQNLLAEILPLLRPFRYANLSNEVLTQLLLYGDENLPNNVNRNILKLTLRFIKETGLLKALSKLCYKPRSHQALFLCNIFWFCLFFVIHIFLNNYVWFSFKCFSF